MFPKLTRLSFVLIFLQPTAPSYSILQRFVKQSFDFSQSFSARSIDQYPFFNSIFPFLILDFFFILIYLLDPLLYYSLRVLSRPWVHLETTNPFNTFVELLILTETQSGYRHVYSLDSRKSIRWLQAKLFGDVTRQIMFSKEIAEIGMKGSVFSILRLWWRRKHV